MAKKGQGNGGKGKRITRYSYDNVKEPRTPETGHTALLPADEQVVSVPMDNGWSKAIKVGKLPDGDERPIVLDMDPAVDPVLFWAGKRNRREVPILPLQRNEVVRIAHRSYHRTRPRPGCREIATTDIRVDIRRSGENATRIG
jgi:hypothetical protein